VTDTLRDRIAGAVSLHEVLWQANAEHLADAILAIPGIAVVELPEPARVGRFRCWPALVGGEPESVYRAGDEVVVSGGLRLYADEARDLAAALLACSVKRNGKDGKQSASPTFSPKPNSDARRKAVTGERT
jgi:hypothetical protein